MYITYLTLPRMQDQHLTASKMFSFIGFSVGLYLLMSNTTPAKFTNILSEN